MLNEIINIFLLLLVTYYGFKDIKTSVLIYIVGTFIAPVLRVNGLELSFDIWCFPLIFVCYMLKKRNFVFVRHGEVSLIPYLFVYLVLSSVNAMVFNCGLSVATIYATIRFIVLIKMIIDLSEGQLISFIDKALGIIILINAVCAIIQMMNIVPVETFYDLYYKETMKPLLNQLEVGYFNRAYGTTAGPVILGGIASLTYTFYLSVYVSGKYNVKRNVLKIVACIICGILALSKTAILAFPIITLYTMVMCTITNESKKALGLLKAVMLIFVGTTVLYFVVPWMEKEGFAIAYYLKFLTEPLEALSSRYDSNSGQLAEAMAIIEQNFLFGVGHATFNGVFIGDSVYIVLLYHTGLVGLISYLLPFVIVLFRSIKSKNLVKSSLVIVFFLIATGNSLYLSHWVIPFVAVMFMGDVGETVAGNQLEQHKRQGIIYG